MALLKMGMRRILTQMRRILTQSFHEKIQSFDYQRFGIFKGVFRRTYFHIRYTFNIYVCFPIVARSRELYNGYEKKIF